MAKKLSEIYVDFTGRLGKLRAAMSKAHQIVKKGMSSLAKWAKRGAIALGVSLAAGLAFSVKAAASFEAQMAKVATMLGKQTMHYIPRFGRAVKDLAIKFGEATVSITGGLYSILSASISAGKAIKFLRVSMMAAKGGFTDTATAAYVLTGVMNAYGYAAAQVMKVSDILFTIQKKGQTSFVEFAPVLGRVTSIAAAMGVKLEEVAAALATLTRSGISTAESITFLRGLIVSLSGRSKESIKIAKQYGIELSVEALQAKGLTGMLKDLSKISDDVLKDIVKETEARTGLIILIGKLTEYEEDLDDVMHSAGETAKAQAKVTATLSEKFKSLWESIKMLAVDTGERFMPMMKSAVDSMIKKFSKMRDELAAIWIAVEGDFGKFLDVLYQLMSIKLEHLVKDMAGWGRLAADAFGQALYKKSVEWNKKWMHWSWHALHKKWEREEQERRSRLEKGIKDELAAHKKIADEKTKAVYEEMEIEKKRQKALAMLAGERAEREKEGAEDVAKTRKEEAERLRKSEETRVELVKKLEEERRKAIEESTKAEKRARIEKLQKLKAMYATMKGYEKEFARVQRLLWKEQAKEYAKTGLITAQAAYAGLAAKAAEAPLGEAAGKAKAEFVSFQEAWRGIVRELTTGRVGQSQLEQLKQQTQFLKSMDEGIGDVTSAIEESEGGYGA